MSFGTVRGESPAEGDDAGYEEDREDYKTSVGHLVLFALIGGLMKLGEATKTFFSGLRKKITFPTQADIQMPPVAQLLSKESLQPTASA
jgi:hypothetical protein